MPRSPLSLLCKDHYLPVCQGVSWSALADPNKEATQRFVNQQVFSFPGSRKDILSRQGAAASLQGFPSYLPCYHGSARSQQRGQHLPAMFLVWNRFLDCLRLGDAGRHQQVEKAHYSQPKPLQAGLLQFCSSSLTTATAKAAFQHRAH